MNEYKTLVISNYKGFKSTNLMQELEKPGIDGARKYDYLLFKNVIRIWNGDTCYYASLHIGRLPLGTPYISDSLTFTQINNTFFGKEIFEKRRKEYNLTDKLYDALDFLLNTGDDTDELFFDTPIHFFAQNRYNRYVEGFGKTTGYAIWGVKFSFYFSM